MTEPQRSGNGTASDDEEEQSSNNLCETDCSSKRIPFRPQQFLPLTFCVAYGSATLWFFALHMLGDSASQPAAYFFTWDMFPYYDSESRERVVWGETADGKMIQLLPGPTERYRLGMDHQLTRYDLFPEVLTGQRRLLFQQGITSAVNAWHAQHPKERLRVIVAAEAYWPAKMNYNEQLYQKRYGKPNPHRKGWRVLMLVDIDEAGRIDWAEQ